MRLRSAGAAWLGLLLLSTLPAYSAEWKDLWWLQKASRALRGGDGLRANEDPARLLSLGREGVVREFLADPRFADSVLEFNLMVLGFRQDRIREEDGTYKDIIYELPHAIAAARAVLTGGDYFDLFNLQFPIYLGPLRRTPPAEAGDSALPAPKVRQKFFRAMQNDLKRILALAEGDPPAAPVKICGEITLHRQTYLGVDDLGVPPTIPRVIMKVPAWYGKTREACESERIPHLDFASEIRKIIAQNSLFFAKLAAFEPAVYSTPTVASIKALDLSDLNLGYTHGPFTLTVGKALQNSSTNLDRKRAAYYLKRFFCDDLAPIGVEMPAAHPGDPHGQDATCFSCHFKLDPMAGFFRTRGFDMADFSTRPFIMFDDTVTVERVEYEKHWQPGPDSRHSWNVGYVRSPTDFNANAYGSSLEDLYRFLRTAPETRRCLMKRLTEFFTHDEQTVDGDFLDYLTERFTAETNEQGSGPALKNAAARIVLSSAFSTPDADPATCYDRRPGQDRSSGAPCRVAWVLAKDCVRCHSSAKDRGGLDLSKWQPLPDGSTGFPHFDKAGALVSGRKTIEQLLERVSSPDPSRRMPPKGEMDAYERQALYLWANSELARGGR
jgi:hypothetical protein